MNNKRFLSGNQKFNYYFTVTPPKILLWSCVILIVIFIFVGIAEFVQTGKPNTKMWILSLAFPFIPSSLMIWYCLTFKISVDDYKISVIKSFGFRKFSLGVSEISHIKWKIIPSGYGDMYEISVKSPHVNFSFELIMENSEHLIRYILGCVDKQKIEFIDKRKHKI